MVLIAVESKKMLDEDGKSFVVLNPGVCTRVTEYDYTRVRGYRVNARVHVIGPYTRIPGSLREEIVFMFEVMFM